MSAAPRSRRPGPNAPAMTVRSLARASGWRRRGRTAAAGRRGPAMRRGGSPTWTRGRSALADEAETLAARPGELASGVTAAERSHDEARALAATTAEGERAAEAALRAVEDRGRATAETLSAAREARAGAVARAENQELRRIEMGRLSGERFECPAPVLPEKLGFRAPKTSRRAGEESAAHDRLIAGARADRAGQPRRRKRTGRTGQQRRNQRRRARRIGPGGQPAARFDRHAEPRGPRSGCSPRSRRSTRISAGCSRPCSRAARRIWRWSIRTIRWRRGWRSWRSRRARDCSR